MPPSWLEPAAFATRKRIAPFAVLVFVLSGLTAELVAQAGTPVPLQTSEASAQAADPETAAQSAESSTPKAKLPAKYDIDRIGDRGIGGGFNLFSLEKERALGEAMSQRHEAHVKLVADPDINLYVNRVVQNLAMHSDAKLPITVRVVKNDGPNAYSFPGGFLYVTTGLIAVCPDEATFAGILAHEVAHIAARHVTKTITRRTMVRLATLPLMFLSGGVAAAVDNTAAVAMPMSNAKFVRDSEHEADLLALEYAYVAGYDPVVFVQFFETIEARQKRKIPGFMGLMFMPHLMNADRIRRLQAFINTALPAKTNYIIDTSDFSQLKARLFQVTEQPCRGVDGRPVLLSAGRQCPDPAETNDAPKLRRK